MSNTAPALAADWSGPYGGLSAGGGFGEQSQQGGVLALPRRGGTPAAASQSAGGVTTTCTTTTITKTSTVTATTTVGTIIAAAAAVTSVCGTVTKTVTTTTTSTVSASADGRYRMSGGLVGGSVGYNFQTERFVYGASLDGSVGDISGNGTCGAGGALPHACGGSIRGLGTARAHLGYDVLGAAVGPFGGLQVFAAGGGAIAQVHAWDSLFNTSGSRTLTGWTAGGGVEALFGPHWSVTLEYLHVDLGQHAIFTAIAPTPERVRTTMEIVRLGLSFHFNAAYNAPIVAKY